MSAAAAVNFSLSSASQPESTKAATGRKSALIPSSPIVTTLAANEVANGNSSAQISAVTDDDALDVKGAMVVLKLGRSAVYDGCARGQIPHRRIGKLLRFSRAGLRGWLSFSSTFASSQRKARG